MNGFSNIFGQILHLFSKGEFFETVYAMQAERGAKGFSCGDQFVAMLFASWDKPIRYERFYEKIFYQLLGKCRQLDFGKHRFQFKNKLFSLDATVIELCASLSDWARFRQTKGAVKLHLLLDHDGYLPVFATLPTERFTR